MDHDDSDGVPDPVGESSSDDELFEDDSDGEPDPVDFEPEPVEVPRPDQDISGPPPTKRLRLTNKSPGPTDQAEATHESAEEIPPEPT